MKKAAIYIRVSTQEQAKEGYSIEAQKESLINYCKAKGWLIQNIYVDGGFTGSNINRPALERLLGVLKDIDVVLVYKLDRLSRSQKDTLYLIEDKFIKNNVDFVSMSESFDTGTPIGKMMIGILSTFAQFERENIKERITSGRVERAKSGLWRGGARPPIGYDYIDGELLINEYEAMQIRKIFKLYLQGWGQEKINNYLASKGYTTKYGDWIRTSTHTVYRIIQNPVYIGKVSFNGELYVGNHEQIIDDDTFKKANEMYEKRRVNNTKSKHLLAGLLTCSRCGSKFITDKKRDYSYYICYNRKRGYKDHIEKCDNKIWRVDDLDKKVIDKIKKITNNKTSIKKIYDEIVNKQPSNDNTVIEGRIIEIDKQITKLMDLYQMDKIPVDVISKRIEDLYDEKKKLEKEKVEYIDNNVPAFEEVYSYLKNFNKTWDKLDNEKKKVVLNDLLSGVTIDNDDIKLGYNDQPF